MLVAPKDLFRSSEPQCDRTAVSPWRDSEMKNNLLLTISSLLSIIFLSLHHADDVVRGFAPGKFSNLIPVFILVVWLYGTTLVLAEHRWGYIIVLILSLLGAGVPVVHMRGAGIAGG